MDERIASLFASAAPVREADKNDRAEEQSSYCIVPVSFQLIEALMHDLPHDDILDSLVSVLLRDGVCLSLIRVFSTDERLSSVSWRHVILKLHQILLSIDGLNEILQVHGRNQVRVKMRKNASGESSGGRPKFFTQLFSPVGAVGTTASASVTSAILSTFDKPRRQVMPVTRDRAMSGSLNNYSISDLSSSLPPRPELGSFMPPMRLTDAILNRRTSLSGSSEGPQQQQQQPVQRRNSFTRSGDDAATPVVPVASADTAPPKAAPFDVAGGAAMVSVSPAQRYARGALDKRGAEGDGKKPRELTDTSTFTLPEWMHFVVHWDQLLIKPQKSIDPRGARIPLIYLMMAIQSQGAYDHALKSVVCQSLWKAAGDPRIILGPYLPPQFLQRNLIELDNRCKAMLDRDWNQLCKFVKDTQRIKSYLKWILSASTKSDVQKALSKLQSDVSLIVKVNHLDGTAALRSLCIGMLGLEDELCRDKAVVLLNMMTDSHSWQREAALRPAVRQCGDAFELELHGALADKLPVPDEKIFAQISAPAAGCNVLYTVPLVRRDDTLVATRLPLTFSRPGFCDWRFVALNNGGLLAPLRLKGAADVSIEVCGRVVVVPKHSRTAVVHEASLRSTFEALAEELPQLKQSIGFTVLYLRDALERNETKSKTTTASSSALAPTDRGMPRSAAGGVQGFAVLAKTCAELGVRLVVDATVNVAASGYARRYEGLFALCKDEFHGYLRPLPQTEVPGCALINYRDPRAWDMLLDDMQAMCDSGARGFMLNAADSWPVVIPPDSAELSRKDPDGALHYSLLEIMLGRVSLADGEARAATWGYYGTSAATSYPNPFLVALASRLWARNADLLFLADVGLDREHVAVSAGLVPLSRALSDALMGLAHPVPQVSSTKLIYDWFRLERFRCAENAVMAFRGTPEVPLDSPFSRAIVDLMFMGPDIPYVRQFSPSSAFAAHLSHRVRLRHQNAALSEGGLMPLLAFCDTGWHDRVFGFARFTDLQLAVVAINLNDAESIVYIDLSPLRDLCEETDDTVVYKVTDLINPSIAPLYYSPAEFLLEHHYTSLDPYSSVIWTVSVDPLVGSERALYEQSMKRLLAKLHHEIPSEHNLIWTLLTDALARNKLDEGLTHIQSFIRKAGDWQLPTNICSIFYHMTRSSRETESRVLDSLRRYSTDKSLPVQALCARILEANKLGPVVFITPELGRFSTVGGIGVMVNELSRSLAEIGVDVHVVSPYYNYNKRGETGYLEKEGIVWKRNIFTFLGSERIEIGVHYGEEFGVKLHFLHNWRYFSTPYHAGSPQHQLETLVLTARSTLEFFCQVDLIPSIVLTNDWSTALVPAYGKETGAFGSTFSGTTFLHLIHNLETGYEGRIWLDSRDDLGHIHQMPRELIVESADGNKVVLNASKVALLTCDQWATVSRSYREDLLNTSPLAFLLKQFPVPFAHSNGIRSAEKLEKLKALGFETHAEAKRALQEKYFAGNVSEDACIFAFIGRVVVQKGVHLILAAARELLRFNNVQVLVGGPANPKDPYAADCAWKMRAMANEFKGKFWADPDLFFTDGVLVNAGADFGLMPSLFEPSGIVQQEFFLGGTPVICYRTGGLKDTVTEFDGESGNGFTFEAYTFGDLGSAIKRALNCFKDSARMNKLRANAKLSVLDNKTVADAWLREFCRIKKRMVSLSVESNVVEI